MSQSLGISFVVFLLGVNFLSLGCGKDVSKVETKMVVEAPEQRAVDNSVVENKSFKQNLVPKVQSRTVKTQQHVHDLLLGDVVSFFWISHGQSVVLMSNQPAEYSGMLRKKVADGGKLLELSVDSLLQDLSESSLDMLIFDGGYHQLVATNQSRADWLQEVSRILRPEGTLIVIDNAAPQASAAQHAKDGLIDQDFVVDEVIQNGFDMMDINDLLRKQPNQKNGIVAENSVKPDLGKFMLKFRKQPEAP